MPIIIFLLLSLSFAMGFGAGEHAGRMHEQVEQAEIKALTPPKEQTCIVEMYTIDRRLPVVHVMTGKVKS